MNYTVKNLREVEDVAPKFGMGAIQEARFPRHALETEQIGFAYHRIKPNQRGGAHQHQEAEEVYVVLAGGGRVYLDGDLVELQELDAVRVAPAVARAFQAGPDGLDLLVFGTHFEGDGRFLEEDVWAS